ncbi:MAG: hypothetical protein GY859_42425 [Desulfobacterales bacterium]|nr:hypothetical protein [Desulfobacterales bacterium]
MSHRARGYFSREISWRDAGSAEFPYETAENGVRLKIRVNDFPVEPLYTLLIDDVPTLDFDDWPEPWRRPPSRS